MTTKFQFYQIFFEILSGYHFEYYFGYKIYRMAVVLTTEYNNKD